MGSEFDINAVNPLSPQILSAWNANAAAYNATNPKYPYPAAPSAIYGVWRFAGLERPPSPRDITRISPTVRRASAWRTGLTIRP